MRLDDENFRLFAGTLAATIKRYGEMPDDTLLDQQRRQFEELVALEAEFRGKLIASSWGPWVYHAFVKKICDKEGGGNGNILTSRPYFRERQDVCVAPISEALKNRDPPGLYPFRINFNFVAFALAYRAWPKRHELRRLAAKIERLRREIVELNMPLAINQARLFWHKAPMRTNDYRYTFMDFVQVAADGLITAVDKFVVPPPEVLDADPDRLKVWRAVAIGRIRGNCIEQFSTTNFHFYPPDRRKLYRANKHLREHVDGVDYDRLAAQVNADLEEAGGQKLVTNGVELAAIMGAASNGVSLDKPSEDQAGDGVRDTMLDRAAAPASWQPDVRYEQEELLDVLGRTIRTLPTMEQKVVRLRGVDARDPTPDDGVLL